MPFEAVHFRFMIFAFVGKYVQMQVRNFTFSNEEVLDSTVLCMPSAGACKLNCTAA